MGKFSSLIRGIGSKKRFNSAIILAAGKGTRFSEDRKKQFIEVDKIPVIVRSAMAFQMSEDIHEIVVVTATADIEGCRNLLKSHGITKLTSVVSGGNTRRESAKNGFDAVNPECDFVAIHDAARCLITPDIISDVMEAAYVNGASACATAAVDTLKTVNGNGIVTETLDRTHIMHVQTPQVFMADMYRAAAYTAEKDGFEATDDCQLCERLGFKVQLVNCKEKNIKITYPEDIIIAEAILESRKRRVNNTDFFVRKSGDNNENRTWI